MNKPQLSAEIIKLGIINEDGSITFAYNELATALEDERNKVIELLKKSLGYHCDEPNCDHNLEEAIKVLNQLKGTDATKR